MDDLLGKLGLRKKGEVLVAGLLEPETSDEVIREAWTRIDEALTRFDTRISRRMGSGRSFRKQATDYIRAYRNNPMLSDDEAILFFDRGLLGRVIRISGGEVRAQKEDGGVRFEYVIGWPPAPPHAGAEDNVRIQMEGKETTVFEVISFGAGSRYAQRKHEYASDGNQIEETAILLRRGLQHGGQMVPLELRKEEKGVRSVSATYSKLTPDGEVELDRVAITDQRSNGVKRGRWDKTKGGVIWEGKHKDTPIEEMGMPVNANLLDFVPKDV